MQAKYLEVTLDSELNCFADVREALRSAQKALVAFLWWYEVVIRPPISHGCVVW